MQHKNYKSFIYFLLRFSVFSVCLKKFSSHEEKKSKTLKKEVYEDLVEPFFKNKKKFCITRMKWLRIRNHNPEMSLPCSHMLNRRQGWRWTSPPTAAPAVWSEGWPPSSPPPRTRTYPGRKAASTPSGHDCPALFPANCCTSRWTWPGWERRRAAQRPRWAWCSFRRRHHGSGGGAWTAWSERSGRGRWHYTPSCPCGSWENSSECGRESEAFLSRPSCQASLFPPWK